MLRVAQHDNSVEHVSLLVFFSILCELIQRTRSVQDREQLPDTLIALPYLEMTPHTWLVTGELGALFRRKVITVGLPDLIVAALAQEYDCLVYPLDSNFRRIPNLSLYTPST